MLRVFGLEFQAQVIELTAEGERLKEGEESPDDICKLRGLGELEICPWALREGVILRRLDHTDGHTDGTDSAYPAGVTGRTGPHGARWRR